MAARTARTVACSRSRAPPRAQGRRRRRRRRRASFGRWRWARRCFGCSGRSVRANGCALTRRWLARAAAGQEVPGASSQRSSAPRSVPIVSVGPCLVARVQRLFLSHRLYLNGSLSGGLRGASLPPRRRAAARPRLPPFWRPRARHALPRRRRRCCRRRRRARGQRRGKEGGVGAKTKPNQTHACLWCPGLHWTLLGFSSLSEHGIVWPPVHWCRREALSGVL